MRITASAISLNVDDVSASAAFAKQHLGFREEMAADGFVSLSRQDAGFNLVFLRTGLPTFKPERARGRADGLLIVFVVDDVDAEYTRLQEEGVPITTPIETEPWGERFFQVTDPNGVTIQLVQWLTTPGAGEIAGRRVCSGPGRPSSVPGVGQRAPWTSERASRGALSAT